MDKFIEEAIDMARDPFSLIVKGPRFLADWMKQRQEKAYQEFIDAACVGGVFPENADAMTPEDFVAIIRSLEQEMEAEKSKLYGRLARSIALGAIRPAERRHFIKALRELSFNQVERLRSAHIAAKFNLHPRVGAGSKRPSEFLSSLSEYEKLQIHQFSLIDTDKLSGVGERFIESCYLEDELTPTSIGENEWANGMIDIICNEMGDPKCLQMINDLSAIGHKRLVKVRNQSAFRSNTPQGSLFKGSLVVLLFRDPAKLVDQWKFVEERIKPKTDVVTASFDDGSGLAPPLSTYPHLDAEANGTQSIASSIVDHFHGLSRND